VRSEDFLYEEEIGLATYTERCIAAFHIMMLLSHFSNYKPAKHLVRLNGFSYWIAHKNNLPYLLLFILFWYANLY